MKTFGGPVIVLDRNDINTDEIIPAKYLTEVEKEALKPFILEDLILPGFDPKGNDLAKAKVIVTRGNFGCGSSREHAAWVLEVNGITLVVAESFARIFRQNMFNGGMLAIELPKKDIDEIIKLEGEVSCHLDWEARKLSFLFDNGGTVGGHAVHFELSEFDAALVEAGGWVEFADARY